MLIRALIVWFGLLLLAFANAAFREMALVPGTGETAARAISSVTLSAAVVLLAWFTIRWIGATSTGDAWTIGTLWLVLTLAFEFLVGHYICGNPWNELWADYNVFRGRIWVLVLLTTLLAPVLMRAYITSGRRLLD